jgi:hypothetical protein
MLVLKWGDWGNGPNLLLCSLAATRSARCSKDTTALSRSVGSQDRIVARVRRGGHIRPGLAFFQPRCHSCHCRGQRCGRCRGNHQIVPLFCTRAALGSASVLQEAGKWCACAPLPISRGMISESFGLTSHKSSCNCTGCGMLRAGVCINLRREDRGADPRVGSRRDCRRAVLRRLPRGDRAVFLHPARTLARAAHTMSAARSPLELGTELGRRRRFVPSSRARRLGLPLQHPL